jgi:hypothetical protein
MATYTVEEQNTAITTATTTTILSAISAAADEKRVKAGMISIRNKGAANNTITVQKDTNNGAGTDYELSEFTLGADEEWTNPWDMVLATASMVIEVVTSSTSAIDVCVSYLLKDDA